MPANALLSPPCAAYCLQSKVGPFGACVTREGSWCNYISVPNTPEGKGRLSSRVGWDGAWWLGILCGQGLCDCCLRHCCH